MWVAIGRWSYAGGSDHWYLELWDAQGEAGDDTEVADSDSAKALAFESFGVPADGWCDGAQPFSR